MGELAEAGACELVEQAGDIEVAVLRCIGREPPPRLLELALAGAGSPRHVLVVPRDGDMDETLEEVALGRLGRAPSVLERLVRLEEAAGSDQLESELVAALGLTARGLRRRP